jgi:hypothetical protein
MKFTSSLAMMLTGAALLPTMASAHHSFSMFDRNQRVEKTGVIKNVEWTNPHVWVYILANNEQGVQEEWGFETEGTVQNIRRGWKRDSLKPGDKVTITFKPMRDGTHAGSMTSITLGDGTPLVAETQRPADENNP